MTDANNPSDVYRCPSCQKPTTEGLAQCRHCRAKLTGPDAGKKGSKIFADEGPGAKWGCLGSVALLLGLAGGGVAFCNQHATEQARIEAEQKAQVAKANEERYQESVRTGQVCADGPMNLNTALELNVKRRLKDPDSFEHMGTVIMPLKNGEYDALMRFRSRNSFGGMTTGTVAAKLYVAERGVCEVRTLRIVE